MAQYRIGTVKVTIGSAIVTAIDPDPADASVSPAQSWLSEANTGDWIILKGDDAVYIIDTVDSDAQLTLTTTYTGPTTVVSGTPERGSEYGIIRDFSVNYGFPLISMGDIETATIIQLALTTIDIEMNDLNNRITAIEA